MNPLLLCLTTLATHASAMAQTVGGEWSVHEEFGGTGANGHVGHSIAALPDIDGDGVVDFIIGVPEATTPGVLAGGQALVYSGASNALLFELNGTLPGEILGTAVGHAGDFNQDGVADIIVGAPLASPGGLYGAIHQAGSVYVFSGVDGSLLHRFDGRSQRDQLGLSVGFAGDVNGDGVDDVIFGTPWSTVNQRVRRGMVAVCSGGTGDLLYLIEGDVEYARLGWRVGAAGDTNGDGFDDFLYSAPGSEVAGQIAAGSVFLHSGFDGSLLRRIDGAVAGQTVGDGMVNIGDLDGDGVPDLAVNQYGSYSLVIPDRVQVYSGATGVILQTLESPGAIGASYGFSIAGVGDVDADGTLDLLVGAYDEFVDGRYRTGAVYLHSGASGQLMQRFEGRLRDDNLGWAVSGLGDINGDIHPELLMSAPNGYYTSYNAGEVFIYSLDPMLHASRREVSVVLGGTVNLGLDFPSSHAGDAYQVLLSTRGMGPSNYGVDIPLAFDGFLLDSWFGRYPFANQWGLEGVLNSNGDAQGGFRLPPGLPPGAVGESIWFAAVAHPLGQLPTISSIAVSLQLVP